MLTGTVLTGAATPLLERRQHCYQQPLPALQVQRLDTETVVRIVPIGRLAGGRSFNEEPHLSGASSSEVAISELSESEIKVLRAEERARLRAAEAASSPALDALSACAPSSSRMTSRR